MSKNTINNAIKEAFRRENKPLRVKEVFWRIKEDNLYDFNTQTPEHVVRTALRRHTESLDFASSSPNKLYVTLNDGTYWLKGKQLDHSFISKSQIEEKNQQLKNSLDDLLGLQQQHIKAFKIALLDRLKRLEPRSFELFCKKLLKAYGFSNTEITRVSRDGGIDGYGELKIGLSHLNVAFQCKRWNTSTIGRKEIDMFRGASQGSYQQAIFFTTSTFTKEARAADNKTGAIPIALFDGDGIVNMMIEKKFGVEVQEINTYVDALDQVLEK
ncbi:hypothetical protein BCY91_12605 [Pelobium manganitolerans]|uniref:HTH HARE-type domain-containing protein n=1 Tax=Pelobium manganitolerans TaxID=1842495 RepID=A0A419S1V9_9SPHI|nr:restriction endonuclease [Pelobium manganitolerans]RKD12479.1 hypothetical protein BCY91_12605 [Pelobium manganitolerans]